MRQVTSERPGTRQRAVGSVLGASALIAVATGLSNVAAYSVSLAATRQLGPEGFGEVAALLGLVTIGNVAALGLQTVTARAVAADRQDNAASGSVQHRTAIAFALAVGAVGVAVSLVLARLVGLSAVGALLSAASLVPLTYVGWTLGRLQGAERFGQLAAMVAALSVLRFGGCLVGLFVGGTPETVMLGGLVGLLVTAVLALAWVLPGPRRSVDGRGPGVRRVFAASITLLGLFALTNVDVLLARWLLDARDAGLYAAGTIIAKVAFWLPAFVAVVALPRLVDAGRRRAALAASAAVLLAVSVVVVLGTALLSGVAVSVIGGPHYLELQPELWLFAVIGSAYSLVQLATYSRLARGARRTMPAFAAALGALVALAGLLVDSSLHTLALVAATVAVTSAAVGLCFEWRAARSSQPAAGHGPGL